MAQQETGQSAKAVTPRSPTSGVYHASIRLLHWAMAVGFLIMWVTGMIVTNMEGVPFWTENDRQGVVRDFHKSVGLTLLALLVVRIGLRLVKPAPELPQALSEQEKRRAHLGHFTIYAAIVVACVTGYAIADVQDYGNAYFGIELPALFPKTDSIAGWSSSPWAYVLHAIVAYGLLLLILGHVYFVRLHAKLHGVDILSRMTGKTGATNRALQTRLLAIVFVSAVAVTVFATRAFVTLGPTEEPRDYVRTTPFSR